MNRVEKVIVANAKAFQDEVDYYQQRYTDGDISLKQALKLIEEGREHINGRINWLAPRLSRLTNGINQICFEAKNYIENLEAKSQ